MSIFFSGESAREGRDRLDKQTWRYYRVVDGSNGAFYCMYQGQPVVDAQEKRVWDTYAAY